jgi:hypothetical protein
VLSVKAPVGTVVSVAGSKARSGSFKMTVKRAWDQSFGFSVTKGGAAPVKYYVRCSPTDMTAITAARSGTPSVDFYLLSAYASRYVEVVNTEGVPVWWYRTAGPVGDIKMLPNGLISWLPSGNPAGITVMPLSGTPVTNVPLPGGAVADSHDYEPLPNGNWLMQSYPYVSGVDLSSIGGASDTCILDAKISEVTPQGQEVWSWYASQHLSPTELNANVQPRVAVSSCAGPVDMWHLNSLEPVGNDVVLSMRFVNAVHRINRTTGNVVWKLGGSTTPESLTLAGDPYNGFIGQHDARMWPDGSASVFDNGADGRGAFIRKPRMVRYAIDTNAGTATMVQQIQDPSVSGPATCCGSARLLPNGNWAIGYGQLGLNAEVTSSGARVLSLNFSARYAYRMTPVPAGLITAGQLRAGMDAMHTGAPSKPVAVPFGNGGVRVSWAAPVRNGAAAVTGYIVTPYLGSVAQPARTFNSTATSQRVRGLGNGKTYQFVVSAKVAGGVGAPSSKSSKVIVGAPGKMGRPATVNAASGSLKVTFPPALANGAKVTGYVVRCRSADGGGTRTKVASSLAITVAGLTAGKAYACTVAGMNGRGTGPPSQPSIAAQA